MNWNIWKFSAEFSHKHSRSPRSEKAKEVCIDETLSALDAGAYEAELIKLVVLVTDLEGTSYSGVDSNTLVWISTELIVIAMEESRHSLLAWRS